MNKWKTATNSFGIHQKQIRKNVKHYAIKDVHDRQHATSSTSFPLNCPGTMPANRWFSPKPWINDSGFTKIFAEFRSCNARLGNRGPTKDGRFFKLCPLCSTDSAPQLNNEVTTLKILKGAKSSILGSHAHPMPSILRLCASKHSSSICFFFYIIIYKRYSHCRASLLPPPSEKASIISNLH